MVSHRLDELLEVLDVGLMRNGKRLVGCCPIHGGNNPAAFNMYPDGHTVKGNWKCWTRHCETIFKKTLVGFVRGVLSHQKFGYDGSKETRTVKFHSVMEWLCKFLNQDIHTLKVDHEEIEKRKFAAQVHAITKRVQETSRGWPRTDVRNRLIIPASYYLGRGYSEDILQRYDVGLCKDANSPMANRVVVPVFDEKYSLAVGFTGRSVYAECSKCSLYHSPEHPCPKTAVDILNASKWRNNKGFQKESHLYNLWFAKKHIRQTNTVIFCEGPGDIWRLEEAGIHNAVAIFGSELNDEQQILLETSGAMSVILLLDSDSAGMDAVAKIRQQLARAYDVHVLSLSAKDVGDMEVKAVRQHLWPQIDKICCKHKGVICA